MYDARGNRLLRAISELSSEIVGREDDYPQAIRVIAFTAKFCFIETRRL